MKCTCAQLVYRNLPGGKQERKLVGKTTCTRCRGRGRVLTCVGCEGCGLLAGTLCPSCHGQGVTPQEATHGA